MTGMQKIVLIALVVLGALCLLVGFTLSHHIGGFIRHVEEEAREEEEARRAEEKEHPKDNTQQERTE